MEDVWSRIKPYLHDLRFSVRFFIARLRKDPMERKLSKLPWGGYMFLGCGTPYCGGHGGKCAVCSAIWSDCDCMSLYMRCKCNNHAEGSPFLWRNIKLRFQWWWKAIRQRSWWVDLPE